MDKIRSQTLVGGVSRRGLVKFFLLGAAVTFLLCSGVITTLNRAVLRWQYESVPITQGDERSEIEERDVEMFRRVVDWLETVTSRCRLTSLGGQPICADRLNATDCLVYSVGLTAQLRFERAAAVAGCQVEMFDKTSPKITEPIDAIDMHFHRARVVRTYSPGNGNTYTLDMLLTGRNHLDRSMDVLKLDIDGEELDVLLQQVQDSGDGWFVLDRFDQLALRVYLPRQVGGAEDLLQYDLLESTFDALHQLGFRVVASSGLGQRYLLPGLTRPAHLIYDVLAVKAGHDVWNRMIRGNVMSRRSKIVG